jgi:hypothetical protein
MNDTLLRQLDPADPPKAKLSKRARADLEWILSTDRRPAATAPRRTPRARVALGLAAAAAVAVAVVLAPSALRSGDTAFASWTATASTLPATEKAHAGEHCRQELSRADSAAGRAPVALADRRGDWTTVVLSGDNGFTGLCVTGLRRPPSRRHHPGHRVARHRCGDRRERPFRALVPRGRARKSRQRSRRCHLCRRQHRHGEAQALTMGLLKGAEVHSSAACRAATAASGLTRAPPVAGALGDSQRERTGHRHNDSGRVEARQGRACGRHGRWTPDRSGRRKRPRVVLVRRPHPLRHWAAAHHHRWRRNRDRNQSRLSHLTVLLARPSPVRICRRGRRRDEGRPASACMCR